MLEPDPDAAPARDVHAVRARKKRIPEITDTPPAEIRADLDRLEAALDEQLPPRIYDRNVLYGDSATERTPELRAIAEWLDDWAREVNGWDHNLIALGDFNIDRNGDERYRAFTLTDLTVPESLHEVPRSIFNDSATPSTEKFYDQIAWLTEAEGRPALSLEHTHSGYFDFFDVALPRRDLTRRLLSWRISHRSPLYSVFELP